MKRILSLTILVMSSAWCFGQYHDSAVLNQIGLEEVGAGAAGGSNGLAQAHYLLHKGYVFEAMNNPLWKKTVQRALVSKYLLSEQRAAAVVDSALTSRAKTEALDLADRELDVVWMVEKNKINNSLDKWENNINKITANGGKLMDYRSWRNSLEGIKAAIEGVKKSHLSNSQRQECYTLIYKDIENKNLSLVSYLSDLSTQQTAKNLMKSSVTPVKKVSRKSIANGCFARWKAVIAQSSGVGK